MCAIWRVHAPGWILCHAQMSGADRSAVAGRARVLAVDDDAYFLAVLREVVGATAHLTIAGEAHSGEEAIEAARELRPDVVLMDVQMPGIGGMEAAKVIQATRQPTLILMISTTHPDEIPRVACDSCDAMLWKSTLTPRKLDEIWLERRV